MAASITAYCASCGEDREADAQTGRCLKCGKQAVATTTQAQLDRNSHLTHNSPSAAYRAGAAAPFDASRSVAAAGRPGPAVLESALERHRLETAPMVPQADSVRFRLPGSRPTQKWLETTRTLMETFTFCAAEAEQKAAALEAKVADQVAAFKAEAVRLRNSARVMRQLLEQVGIEAKESASPAVKRSSHGSPLPPGRWSRAHAACIDCGRTDRKHSGNGRCTACDMAWRKRGKVDA